MNCSVENSCHILLLTQRKKTHTLILEHWSKVLSTHVCLKNAQRWAIQSPKTWCAKNASKARLLSLHWNCLKRFKVGNTASGLLTILLHFKFKVTIYPPGKFRTFNRVLIVPLLKLICLMYILKLWFLRNVMIVIKKGLTRSLRRSSSFTSSVIVICYGSETTNRIVGTNTVLRHGQNGGQRTKRDNNQSTIVKIHFFLLFSFWQRLRKYFRNCGGREIGFLRTWTQLPISFPCNYWACLQLLKWFAPFFLKSVEGLLDVRTDIQWNLN